MTLSELIKSIRKERKITLDQLAEDSGISKSTLSFWERGKSPNKNRPLKPSMHSLNKMATYMGISFNQLVEMLNDDLEVKLPPTTMEVAKFRFMPVPVFDPISCGTGSWIDDGPDDYMGVPEAMLPISGEYFANEAEGDSMEPRIHSGDYVVFEKVDQIDSGTIGSFSLNGEYYCKRFKTMPDGSAWLLSENPNYEPIPIRPGDDFRVLGRYRLRLTKQ